MTPPPLSLFQGAGVELEYMIVRRDTLDVAALAETVLRDASGAIQNEVAHGSIAWSNELVSHVVELKTAGPAATLEGLAQSFHANVMEINRRLAPANAQLMPGAMHPWMDPHRETVLWPHENAEIYNAFNRIFDCRGHGWSNLQSMHLNLPFAGDAEFGRLHAAIRLLLPILPAIAASSPLAEGQVQRERDHRLEVYRHNCQRIPRVTGRVIPEPVFDPAAYEAQVLQPMYAEIAPFDPDGILQEEWLNARGAIARFERSAIEIRVIDVQECPRADLAIAALSIAALRALCGERWSSLAQQQSWTVEQLEPVLRACTRDAGAALIDDIAYLRLFGWRENQPVEARELWRHLRAQLADEVAPEHDSALGALMEKGTLAERIVARVEQGAPQREVFALLCECLAQNEMFH